LSIFQKAEFAANANFHARARWLSPPLQHRWPPEQWREREEFEEEAAAEEEMGVL
jgi:hypothetical protein